MHRTIPHVVAAALLILCRVAHATLPQITYTTAIVGDQNAYTSIQPLPITGIGMGPFSQAVGFPPTMLQFVTPGAYNLIAQFLVTSDNAVDWAFAVEWDLATPGVYTAPTITTPMTFGPAASPNTYIATLTIDSLTVSQGDTVFMGASVKAINPNVPYVISPKILHGVAGTILEIRALAGH